MADASLTASQIRPLNGAVIRQFTAGGTITVGDVVYIAADGDVERADANLAVSALGVGIAVASHDDSTTIEAGDPVSVVTLGPVSGFSGLSEGVNYYTSETAGKLADAAPSGAGTWTHAMGYAERASVFFVLPGVRAPVSNS